jgi:FkbH-like protein
LTIGSIEHDVKLVIWDLDDTFWNGTLAEGGIEFIDRNAECIQVLARRGIISSISSKNDLDTVRRILEEKGVWQYFVFPSISFSPKGENVAAIIEKASLRPQNILFIDDNLANLEEVGFYNPGIMLAQPRDLLPNFLVHPKLVGKPDPELKRLKQYQLLERKFVDWQSTDVSNEEFLRRSDIRLRFDYEVELHFDRVVDLINRSNQLNYTKVRLRSDQDVRTFRASLSEYGVAAGCVSCSDRYGDYGIIGFFLLKKYDGQSELLHFVFSCRTMNMGVEQFVYNVLGRPKIAIVPDVACALDSAGTIDWIAISEGDQKGTLVSSNKRLLLVGGCDLEQVASFSSSNRVEFVNRMNSQGGADYIVRYDDPCFFTADRHAVRLNEALPHVSGWTYEDVIRLDQALVESDIIIVAMRAALRHHYVKAKGDILIRMEERNIRLHLENQPDWFRQHFEVVNVGRQERLALIRKSFETIANRKRANADLFLVGANTRKEASFEEKAVSASYNALCKEFCRHNGPKFHFIDIDQIVPQDCLIDSQHFSRAGYHALSVHIMRESVREAEPVAVSTTAADGTALGPQPEVAAR